MASFFFQTKNACLIFFVFLLFIKSTFLSFLLLLIYSTVCVVDFPPLSNCVYSSNFPAVVVIFGLPLFLIPLPRPHNESLRLVFHFGIGFFALLFFFVKFVSLCMFIRFFKFVILCMFIVFIFVIWNRQIVSFDFHFFFYFRITSHLYFFQSCIFFFHLILAVGSLSFFFVHFKGPSFLLLSFFIENQKSAWVLATGGHTMTPSVSPSFHLL
jgi:hypothetical protein